MRHITGYTERGSSMFFFIMSRVREKVLLALRLVLIICILVALIGQLVEVLKTARLVGG